MIGQMLRASVVLIEKLPRVAVPARLAAYVNRCLHAAMIGVNFVFRNGYKCGYARL